MRAVFLDSSAILKRYLRETGTEWVKSLFRRSRGDSFYVSSIAKVEIASSIARLASGNIITSKVADAAMKQFRADIARGYECIDPVDRIIESASLLAQTHKLRAYDALQLASAVQLGQAIGLRNVLFVCADHELNRAASLVKLGVENPNDH